MQTLDSRWQDDLIELEVPSGSRVLDLGCGTGELLGRLRARGIEGQGVELNLPSILECVGKGIPVFQADIDEGLACFPDNIFDYVILEETIQTLHYPTRIIQEMLRVGKKAIITFPNFGHWRIRCGLATRGRMPKSTKLPYSWNETPNIHLCTIKDFLESIEDLGIHIVAGYTHTNKTRKLRSFDNLLAKDVLFILSS